MRISALQVELLNVPQASPLLLSGGRHVAKIPHALLRITVDEGIEGIGFAYRLGMTDAAPVARAAEEMANVVVGLDPLCPEAVRQALDAAVPAGSPFEARAMAASAIDVALWDIAGKAAGQPLWKLLGGAHERVQAYASGGLWRSMSPGQLRDAVERHKKEGFRAVKVRIGESPTPDQEAERVGTARAALGETGTLLADVNQGWDAEKAIATAKSLEPHRLGWLEDPVGPQDVDGMASVAGALETPVCAGEHYFSKQDVLRLLRRDAVDILMADVLRVGGVTEWRKIAGLAETFGLPITAHLCPEVSVHLVAGAANGYMVECMPVSAPLFREKLAVQDGYLVAPANPGLGIQLDEDAVRRYRED